MKAMKHKTRLLFVCAVLAFAHAMNFYAMSEKDIVSRHAQDIANAALCELFEKKEKASVATAYGILQRELSAVENKLLPAVRKELSEMYGQSVTMQRLESSHPGLIKSLWVNEERTRMYTAGGDDCCVAIHEKHGKHWHQMDFSVFRVSCAYYVREVTSGNIAVGLLRGDKSFVRLYKTDIDNWCSCESSSWFRKCELPITGIATSCAATNDLKRCAISTRDEEEGSTIHIFEGETALHTLRTDLYITDVTWHTDDTVIMQSDDGRMQSIQLSNWYTTMHLLNHDEMQKFKLTKKIDDGFCVWVDGRRIETGCEGSGLAAVAHSLYRYCKMQEK